MEVVGRRLDLLLCLKCQLVHRAGGILENTVDLEGAAHDDRLRGLFLTLGFASGVLAVDRANRCRGGRLELDVAVSQRGTASAGGNRVIKNEPVQQQRTAAELVNDHLVYAVSHANLIF